MWCCVYCVLRNIENQSRVDPKWDWHIRLGEVSSNFHLSFLSLLTMDDADDDDDDDDDVSCLSVLPFDL